MMWLLVEKHFPSSLFPTIYVWLTQRISWRNYQICLEKSTLYSLESLHAKLIIQLFRAWWENDLPQTKCRVKISWVVKALLAALFQGKLIFMTILLVYFLQNGFLTFTSKMSVSFKILFTNFPPGKIGCGLPLLLLWIRQTVKLLLFMSVLRKQLNM